MFRFSSSKVPNVLQPTAPCHNIYTSFVLPILRRFECNEGTVFSRVNLAELTETRTVTQFSSCTAAVLWQERVAVKRCRKLVRVTAQGLHHLEVSMSERLAHRYKQHWEVLFVPTHLRATASYYPRVEPYTVTTLCSKKHVTTFLMIIWSRTVCLEWFLAHLLVTKSTGHRQVFLFSHLTYFVQLLYLGKLSKPKYQQKLNKIMKISQEDVILIKYLYLSKQCGTRRVLSELPDKSWKLGSIDSLLRRSHKTGTIVPLPDRVCRVAVEDFVLSQEDKSKRHRSAR